MNAEADFIQAERILRIETPLGQDQLLAQKLRVREAISELFEAQMVVRSKSPDLTPQDLLGQAVDLSLELGGGERRAWNAIVTDLMAGARHTRGLREYTLTLRPDLWLMSQRSDCRIWLDKSALDIANDLCGEHGITAPVTAGVVEPVPPQHYSVQWNESDLDYLTRRLEEDGLYYWWTHEPGAHQLHIASHAAGYIGGEDVRFAHGSTDRNHISRFETTFRYIPGGHAGRDWNFTTPGTVPDATTPSLVSLPRNGHYERYTYPMQAGYGPGGRASEGIEAGGVERVARLRMQVQEAEHARVEGGSDVRTLAAGSRFTPYDVANPDNVFDPHVILAVEHEAVDLSYESVENQPDYVNRFLALPADVPATPPLTTARPRIDGTQVAIVAGPEGEEIHPDEYGRIKVWFPWDRRAAKDGSDTCWIRVTQNWAGAGWGGQVIPRIGMEVMVSYLDGDPDRPVVTGVVPNERQRVPYPLPEHKTKSVMRTQTHKADGFNEISFEDATGEENMFFHAQKDQTIKVLHNRSKRVEQDQVESVGSNKAIDVAQNHQESIGGSMNLSVGGGGVGVFGLLGGIAAAGGADALAGSEAVGDSVLSGFVGNLAQAGTAMAGLTGLANGSFARASNHRDAAGADEAGAGARLGQLLSSTMPMSGVLNTVVERFRSDTIGMARTEQIGAYKNTSVGHTMTIHAGREFIINCGKSKFVMDSDGNVTIIGTKFNFSATDHIQANARIIDLN
ncbi:type VI secretion system tip protein TssI/VgrG [Gymnodinialimonas sp. 2305UL16-5]|uniref:type VI secretion system Vgr family protein n=1 Tax=Gymnodinialimonas mytili TaxID=3126503 RepID=UPI0030ACFF2C